MFLTFFDSIIITSIMSTLYLHIGMPKTGSTSIQNFLNQNKSGLAKYNLYFYSDDKYGNFTSLPYAFSSSFNGFY